MRRYLVAWLAGALASTSTQGADPDGFRLVARAGDLGNYYPTYLANGHWSLASSPLGTAPSPVQIAALMDNTPDDVSRPAGVPSFGEIDYHDGSAWLNSTPVQAGTHGDYRQTLDLFRGTLTTQYVWHPAARSTGIRITQLVSQSDPHLAIVHLDLVPHQSGPIRLRFTLRAPPAPARLPLARMSAAEFAARVDQDAARGGRRDVIWYPGAVLLAERGADAKRAEMWFTGRAQAGQQVSLAVAVAVPHGLRQVSWSPIREPDVVGFEVRATATANVHYRFTKFAVASTQSWPLEGGDVVRAAETARTQGYATALGRHTAAWARLWDSDIQIDGDPKLQRTLHSDLFYLLENAASDQALPAAACGFSPHYFGHVFWDNDLWVYPALLLLHPQHARALIDFRQAFLAQAMARAKAHGFAGAMYPWEADPASGEDVTPRFAIENADREVHVNSAVALAQWQYFLASGDRDWLARSGYPVIRAVADFWVSRVSHSAVAGRDEIRDVTSPEEDYTHVDNEIYTNVSARQSLRVALAAADVLGQPTPAPWRETAERLYVPLKAVNGRYLEFDASVPHDKGSSWMASSVPMLAIPALDLDLSGPDLQGLFAHSARAVERVRNHANQMILVMMAILAADAGRETYYADLLGAGGSGQDPFFKPPFNVRSETPQNDSTYLLASSGGFVQAFIYGLTGMRLTTVGLEPRYAPTLPEGISRLRIRGLNVHARRGELSLVRRPSGGVERSISFGPALTRN